LPTNIVGHNAAPYNRRNNIVAPGVRMVGDARAPWPEYFMALREIEFGKLTFLVVEDQEYVRSLIVQLLKRLGVGRVLEEADGAAALTLLQSTTPDFVLCDIKMDPVDGLEFLREVRLGNGSVGNSQLPVVFLTSDSERGTVLAAMENDVDGYLIKPVSLSDLKTKIVTVLNKRRTVSWGKPAS
jgi:two-component system chemotaxis response regulator CheY